MDRELRGFIELFLVVVAIFFVIGALVASLLQQPILSILAEAYVLVGTAYLVASTFAWSGFANVYRYSPTLFMGSPSYRQQAVRGAMWREGRDNHAFLVGLSFGAALIGLGAALYDPVFILVDALVIAGVLLVLYALRSRVALKV